MADRSRGQDRSDRARTADIETVAGERRGKLTWYQEHWLNLRGGVRIVDVWYPPNLPTPEAARRAFERVIARHEVLRTVVVRAAGESFAQVVLPSAAVEAPVLEVPLSVLRRGYRSRLGGFPPPGATEPETVRWRALLGVKNGRVWAIAVAVDTLLIDGWGLLAFRDELFDGMKPEPGKTDRSAVSQPLDRLAYETSEEGRAAGRKAIAQVRGILAEAPHTIFPWPRPAAAGPEGFLTVTVRSAEALRALDAICRRHRMTRPTVVLAALSAVICLWTGNSRTMLRSVSSNRTSPESRTAIHGLYQMTFLGNDLSGDPAFSEIVARTRRIAVEAHKHCEYSDRQVRELIAALSAERGVAFEFPLIFDYLPSAPVRAKNAHTEPHTGLRGDPVPTGPVPLDEHWSQTGQRDLALFTVGVEADELVLSLDADVLMLRPDEIRDLVRWVVALLGYGLGPGPESGDPRLSELPALIGLRRREFPPHTVLVGPSLVDVDRVAEVVRSCPGVSGASAHVSESGALVARVHSDDSSLSTAGLHEYVLRRLPGEPSIVAPDHYVVDPVVSGDRA